MSVSRSVTPERGHVGFLRTAPARVGAAGFALLLLGTALVVTVAAQTQASATAVSGPYELFCPGTPVGTIVLNDATTSGTISPPTPSAGQQFDLTGYQTNVSIPASLASAAAALQPNLQGSATAQVDVTGATPATTSVGPLSFDVAIPSPVPSGGVALALPSTPQTVGPFTATGTDITIQEDASASLTLTVAGQDLALTCTAYPNDAITPSGITTQPAPATNPIAPVIATTGTGTTTTTTQAGTTTTAPPTALTGAYELFCPGTPIGNVVLNDAQTTATISPATPAAGQTFNLTGYQTVVNLPAALASAAGALQPTLTGSATAQIDASGATPATTPVGPLTFDVTIPNPVPAAGVTLSLPSTPQTVGPFTATANGITVQEDSAASLTLSVAGQDLSLTCNAYPNNTITPSGITSSAPSASPIAPVIAQAGSTQPTTTTAPPTTTTAPQTTTTVPVTTTTTTPTGASAPYELYCPGTPVGNIVLNGVVTTGTITPGTLAPGDPFSLTDYQSTVTLPSSIVSAAAALGNTAITGTALTKVDATGATPASVGSGTLTIDLPIPSPVPAAGLNLNLPATPGTVGPFTATGGAITLTVDPSVQLTLVISGSNLNLTCNPYPNNSAPTGITSTSPPGAPASPVIATADATTTTTTTTTPTSTTTIPTTTTTTTAASTTTTSASTTTTAANTTTTAASTTTTAANTTTTTAAATTTTRATTTTAPPTGVAGGTTTTAAGVVRASSGSLAFTGPGPGFRTVTLIGAVLMLLGLALLFLADIPRRALRQLAHASAGRRSAGGTAGPRELADAAGRQAARWARWFLGR